MRSDVLKADEVGGRIADDRVDVGRGSSSSARMKSVIRPGLVEVDRRQRPSTVRRRGAARASTRTMSRRHQAGSARTSSGFIAPQMKQLDLGGTGRPAASIRAMQRRASHFHSRSG
jgi:hypothetical protein